jgi:hypothetical protein
MGKIKLKLDDLKLESFMTSEQSNEKGTINGQGTFVTIVTCTNGCPITVCNVWTCGTDCQSNWPSMCASCNGTCNTCPDTCWNTCGTDPACNTFNGGDTCNTCAPQNCTYVTMNECGPRCS